MVESDAPVRPSVLVAELTHRCPLGCAYCSNPLELEPRERELDASAWARVFLEATALGVEAVHLSGGEPGARRDLVDIAAHAREAGLATTLITSGVGISARTMRDLWEAGLGRVHVSFQDADAVSADQIAGQRGAFQRKHALAAETVRLGLPLDIGFVVHRANIGRIGAMIDLAVRLQAARVEFAALRDQGWARTNRAALAPGAGQVSRMAADFEELGQKHRSRIVIDLAAPGRRAEIIVTPSGRVLPCAEAASIPELECWSVSDRPLAEICIHSPAFSALRDGALRAAPPLAPDLATAQDAAAYTYRRM